MRKLIMICSAAFLLLLAGCSDDDTSDATTDATESAAPDDSATANTPLSVDLGPEEEAYCAELAALPEGEDPGFDAFFAENPEPTLEDWAEFLPGAIDGLKEGLAPFAAVEPPPSLADAHQDVVDAMTAVAGALEAGLTAAAAGDQAAYDEAEAQNQGEFAPAMEEAMTALGGVCGLDG